MTTSNRKSESVLIIRLVGNDLRTGHDSWRVVLSIQNGHGEPGCRVEHSEKATLGLMRANAALLARRILQEYPALHPF